jgi:hypothetical protein
LSPSWTKSVVTPWIVFRVRRAVASYWNVAATGPVMPVSTRGPKLRKSKAQAIEEFHFPSHRVSVVKRLPEITKPANGTLLPPAAVSMPSNLTLVLLAPILRETPGGGPIAYARRPSSPSLQHRPDCDTRLEIDLTGASAFGSNSVDLEDDQSRGPIYCDDSSLLEPGIRCLPCAIEFLEKAPKAAK